MVGHTITSAPTARRISTFDLLCLSVVVKIHLYPFTTLAKAIPIPVLPLVHSIIVPPSFRVPFFSASSTIFIPILSLIELPGLKYSTLAKN